MKFLTLLPALLAVFALAAATPARAQNASPQQIQGMIASGQEQTALATLQAVLQAHPGSGVAWYLTAEAQDASGNEPAARSALANAEHFAPGLPFANPNDVAALQSHLAGAPVQRHTGISPALLGIVGLVILFFAVRMFLRPRRLLAPNGYPGSYGPAGYGPATGPYPYGSGGMGSGLGGTLLGGLAAGAGFAVGERVIGDVFGGNNGGQGGNFPQDQNSGSGGVPDRDDGLSGNPGWDDGSSNQDGNFDPGNNW